jgi:hypothetical protein
MGFESLQHMKDRRSTQRGSAFPLRSAFRVWLPSWRLTPFEPVPVLFHTGSAHGIHPSEHFALTEASGALPPGQSHLPSGPLVLPTPWRRAGPAGSGSWDLTPARVPAV